MVISGVSREWSVRLARLHRLVAAGGEGPTWLWRIRIRILSYLLARYGEPPEPAAPLEPHRPEGDARVIPPEPVPPPVIGYSPRPVAAEHPPKAATAITPVLDEIQALNEGLKAARWENPPPGQAWAWWRTRWCRRR
jgi:hypothetical protein